MLAKALFKPWPVCGLICCLISLLVNQAKIKPVPREGWELGLGLGEGGVRVWIAKTSSEQHKNLLVLLDRGGTAVFPCSLLAL